MRGRLTVIAALTLLPLAACSKDEPIRDGNGVVRVPGTVPVFTLVKGDCAVPPDTLTKDFEGNMSTLKVTPCQEPHTMEFYATVTYSATKEGSGTTVASGTEPYPSGEELKIFAQSRCANLFEDYVGVAYTDSSLFLTFLTPSVRSWNDKDLRDRDVLCFVTTTGEKLTSSVKGSRR